MNAPLRSLLGVVLCALALCLHAGLPPTPTTADFAVREWHSEDGLPNEDVLQLMQDQSGYLWVACRLKLCRFDGASFFPDNAAETRDLFYSMTEEKDGSLLLSPREGSPLRLRDGGYSREPLKAPYTGRAIGSIFSAPDGSHWYALRGTVLRVQGDEVQSFSTEDGVSDTNWTRFAADADGHVWLSGNQFLARYEQGRLLRVRIEGSMNELRVVPSHTDGPWLITPDHIFKFDSNHQPVSMGQLPTLLGAHYVNTAVEDHTGLLWLGTRSAGVQVLGAQGPLSLPTPSDSIITLLEDREGTIWVGANAGGLSAISRKVYTLYNKAAGLAASSVAALCSDTAGDIWVANGDGGIACIRDTQIEHSTLRQGTHVYSASLVSRHPVKGVWAAGGTGAALFHVSTCDSAPQFMEEVPSGASRTAMLTAANGDLWMTTSDRRLGLLRGKTYQVFGANEGVSTNGVRSFAETASGEVLAGTNEGTVLRFDGSRFVPAVPNLEAGSPINTILTTENGLWLGTASNGLVVRQGQRTLQLGSINGLPDDNITQLMADRLGHVWCGSGRGVFRLTIRDVERVLRGETNTVQALRLGRDEGLGMIICQGNYGPGVARGRDGRIWFATRQGALAITPASEALSPPAPSAKIEQLIADDVAQPLTRRWIVAPSTRKLELRFSTLCLSAPSRVVTHYRLIGFDTDWVQSRGSNAATYPSLRPGTYRFEIGAGFGNEITTTPTDSVEIIVPPLWWQTLWFWFAVTALFSTALILIVRLWANRRLRQRVKNLERETAVARVRERIARDIHDEVGSSLTRISLLTQTSLPSSPESENLRRIDETAREVTLALDEIVWAVNPQHDTLEGFIGYLTDFSQKLLSAARVRCRLQIPAAVPVLHLPSEARHDLFLCCRETLHNVVKHAGATEVMIRLLLSETELTLTILDNGRGLASKSNSEPSDRISHGHGLPNLSKRMEHLGGTCEISSPPSGGTLVTLIVPISTYKTAS